MGFAPLQYTPILKGFNQRIQQTAQSKFAQLRSELNEEKNGLLKGRNKPELRMSEVPKIQDLDILLENLEAKYKRLTTGLFVFSNLAEAAAVPNGYQQLQDAYRNSNIYKTVENDMERRPCFVKLPFEDRHRNFDTRVNEFLARQDIFGPLRDLAEKLFQQCEGVVVPRADLGKMFEELHTMMLVEVEDAKGALELASNIDKLYSALVDDLDSQPTF